MKEDSKNCSFVRIEDIPNVQQMQPINPELVKVTGTLKFFYENENYGFFEGDLDHKDVFFHFDDISMAGLTRE